MMTLNSSIGTIQDDKSTAELKVEWERASDIVGALADVWAEQGYPVGESREVLQHALDVENCAHRAFVASYEVRS